MNKCAGRVASLLLTVAAGIGLVPPRAAALPRYAARYEQTCALCHVNPTGGGQRTAYAVQQLVPKELAWKAGQILDLDPKIGKNLLVGADFREIYAASNQPQDRLGFFQMQGNVYLSFMPEKGFTLHFARASTDTYEMFGLAYLLPWSGYVKAGRFVPSHGWKFDDHTMFVRSEEGFSPPEHTDVGLELGVTPGRLDVQVDVLNGDRGSTLGGEDQLAAGVNALYRFSLGGVSMTLGGTGYSQPGRGRDLATAGAFGSINAGALTWVGAGDFIRTDPEVGTTVTGLATSHEVSVLLRQGLELKGTFDFFDPDRDLESGSKWRWGVGVDVMPRPYAVLEADYRATEVTRGPALDAEDFREGIVQLHLLY